MPARDVVLIVDDEVEVAETIRRRLRVEGIEAEVCQDPIEALERMRQRLYPVAVCDIKMPGIDGIELLRRLKQLHPLCNVIMVTGYSSMAHVVDCLGNGAVDYFVKPFQDIGLVVEAVNQALVRIARWRHAMPLSGREG
jgi:CheY-like chemotaxis protein